MSLLTHDYVTYNVIRHVI